MIEDHKDLLKKILITQYRSQRAFAGVLTGRKNLRPDELPSTKGNSRLISINSISENLSEIQNKPEQINFKTFNSIPEEEFPSGNNASNEVFDITFLI